MRQLFHDYVDARLHIYDVADSGADIAPAIKDAERLQADIWRAALAATASPDQAPTRMLVLPPINDMIDITSSRTLALHTRMPALILGLLLGVAVLSALLAGYAMSKQGKRSLLHMALYAAAVSLTTYVILDLDNPRSGLIRLDAADAILRNLRNSI